MRTIDSLKTSIAEDQASLEEDMKFWGNRDAITRALAEVKRTHKCAGVLPAAHAVGDAVEAFVRNKRVENFAQLHMLSYGLCSPVPNHEWSIIERPEFLDLVFSDIEAVPVVRRPRLVYGLSQSYFAYPKYEEPSEEGNAGWQRLRAFIDSQIAFISEALKRLPRWFDSVMLSRSAFGSSPGDAFGAQLLAGMVNTYREFITLLGVPNDSWLRQDVLLGQIRAACAQSDATFLECLRGMIDMMQQTSTVRPSPRVSRWGIGMLLHRYSELSTNVEDEDLRDAALELIGNPWLKPHDWSLYVLKPDGTPSDKAREMVTGWLKRRLITDFFEVLAADGATDRRRLKYWLQYADSIEDLWLFLGDDAAYGVRTAFKEIRQRATGRIMHLKGAGSSANNAFGMKINGFWVIEFGQTGNACFVYKEFPVNLKASTEVRGDAGGLKKPRLATERLLHIDSNAGRWEYRFTAALRRYSIGPSNKRFTESSSQSSTTPRATSRLKPAVTRLTVKLSELEDLKKIATFQIEDHRETGGALWVVGIGTSSPVCKRLREMGFEFKPGRGWWFHER